MPSPEIFSPPAVQINTLYIRIFKISRLRRKKRIYAQTYICPVRKKIAFGEKKRIYAQAYIWSLTPVLLTGGVPQGSGNTLSTQADYP